MRKFGFAQGFSQFKYVPSRADTAGLIECLGSALKRLGIDDIYTRSS